MMMLLLRPEVDIPIYCGFVTPEKKKKRICCHDLMPSLDMTLHSSSCMQTVICTVPFSIMQQNAIHQKLYYREEGQWS